MMKKKIYFLVLILLLSNIFSVNLIADEQVWENDYGQLVVYPMTATGMGVFTQFANFTSNITNKIDVAFRFNSPVKSGHIWYWTNNMWNTVSMNHVVWGGKHYYVYQGFNVVKGVTYRFKWQYIPQSLSGKWDLIAKLSSDTISEALSSGRYILLDPWWNSSWTWKTPIWVQHTYIDNALSGFPVLVNCTDTDIISKCQSNGEDIRFLDSTETVELFYDIIEFTPTGFNCWVNLTSISSSSNTSFYLYYGNNGASDNQTETSVWNNGFKTVYHCNDTSSTIYDATTNGNDGVNTGAGYNAIGILGNALDFENGDDDRVDIGPDSGLDDTGTVECWIKPESVTSTAQYFYSRDDDSPDNVYMFGRVDTDITGYIGVQIQSVPVCYLFGNSSSPITTGSWYYIAWSFDEGNNANFYINGVLEDTDSLGTMQDHPDVNDQHFMGSWYYSGSYESFDGIIDEFRISDVVRNSSWIKATYHTVNSPSLFLDWGEGETESNIEPPTGFAASTYDINSINLSWTKGSNSTHTYIERYTSSDWDRGTGTMVYNDTGTAYDDSDLTSYMRHYYRAWGYATTTGDDGLTLDHVVSVVDDGGVSDYLDYANDMRINWSEKLIYLAVYGEDEIADSGLTILNFTGWDSVTEEGKISRGDNSYLERSHGIAVDWDLRVAYVLSFTQDAINVINISDPSNPTHITEVHGSGSPNYLQEAGYCQLLTQNGFKYLYVTSEADDRLTVWNVTVPASISQVGVLSHANINHPKWCYQSIVDPDIMYMTNYGSPYGITMVDISDPTNPTYDDQILGQENFSFMLAQYGLYVFQIDWNDGGLHTWLVNSGDATDWTLYDDSLGESPKNLGSMLDVSDDGDYVFARSANNPAYGIDVIDVSDKSNPERIQWFGSSGSPYYMSGCHSIKYHNETLFVIGWVDDSVVILNVSFNSTGPLGLFSDGSTLVSNITGPDNPSDVVPDYQAMDGWLNITWTSGDYADTTMVRQKAGSYPTSPSDGNLCYNGTLEYYNHSGPNATDHFTLWSYNVTVNLFSSGANAPFGSLIVNVYNESNGNNISFWNITISNQDGSQSYNNTNCNNTHVIDVSDCPLGDDILIIISHSDYNSRVYYMDLVAGQLHYLNAYLPFSSLTELYYVQVIDNYSFPVENAEINIKRFVNDGFKIISSLRTDAYGYANIFLVPIADHKVLISKTGYYNKTSDWIPDPIYYGANYPKVFKIIFITEGISNLWDNITWSIYPIVQDHYDNFTFYFNITSNNNQLVSFTGMVYIWNSSTEVWELLYSSTSYDSGGGSISYTTVNGVGRYAFVCSFQKTGFSVYNFGVPYSSDKYVYNIWEFISEGIAGNLIDTTITGIVGVSPVYVGDTVIAYSSLIGAIVVMLALFTFSPKFSGVGIIVTGVVLGAFKTPLGIIGDDVVTYLAIAGVIFLGVLVIYAGAKGVFDR